MSVREMSNEERDDLAVHTGDPMGDETFRLWIDIGKRLVHGEKHYGGFKFGEHDLDQMALEEIEDYIVYRAAKKYLAEREQFGKETP